MYTEKEIGLVEYSFQNGDQIVFYEQDTNTIWVCFDGVEIHKEENVIQFKECCKAEISVGQEEYYGDIEDESFDVYFKLEDNINENFIPTRFYTGELMEIIEQ